MQDDCYLIADDGWKATTYRVIEVRKGKDDKQGKEVDKGWACDLAPMALIVARYFAKEGEAADKLAAGLETVTGRIGELEEEHGGEEGTFSELKKVKSGNPLAPGRVGKRLTN
jgi:type I restriction enzyme M protein